MAKKTISLLVLLILLSSSFAFAQDTADTSSSAASDSDSSADKCAGFFGTIKCFLFGSTEARAGKGWFDREALAGMAAGGTTPPAGAEYWLYSQVGEKVKYYKEEKGGLYVYAPSSSNPDNWNKVSSGETTFEQYKNNRPAAMAAAVKTTPAYATEKMTYGSVTDGQLEVAGSYDVATKEYASSQGTFDPQAAKIIPPQAASQPIVPQQGDVISDVFNRAGYTTTKDNYQARKEMYEKQFPGEKFTGTKEQNEKLLGLLSSGELTLLPKSGSSPSAAPEAAVGRQTAQYNAYNSLGSSLYNEYYNKIEWSKVTQQNIDSNTYPLKGKGSIKIEDVGEFQKATVQVGGDSGKSKEILFKNGREVVSQTAKQKESGEFTVGGKAVALSGAALDDFTSANEFTYGKDGGDVYGKISVENGVVTNTDIANEEQTIVDANTGETSQLSGDIYEKGDEGCSEDVCFRANSGTLVDSRGKAYTMDYDYSGTGAGRTLTEIELYDRQGYRSAIQKADGTRITAHQDEKGKYTGKAIIEASPGAGADKTYIVETNDDGAVTSVTTQGVINAQKSYDSAFSSYEKAVNTLSNVEQKWQQKFGSEFSSDLLLITPDDELAPEQQTAKTEILNARNAKDKADTDRKKAGGKLNEEKGKVKEEEAKSLAEKSKDEISSVKDVTAGTQRAVGTALETIYAVTSNIRSYSALSNLLFGESEGYQEWQRWADQSFAPLLSSQWAPSSFCETEARWNDIEPQGKAVIKTAAGTYQTVASIQMERSPETSPLLCYHNSDPEAEEEWICDKKQVCVDDEFCYADDDRDDEPDDDKPLEGYFYKITWGVSAPQDESYTVFKDENGVAVSFNVWIDNSIDDTSGLAALGAVPLYNRAGDTIAPIKLENGDSDRDVMVKYSSKLYQEACIVWHQPPSSVSVAAREGAVAGIAEIPNVCFPVAVSTEGRLEWESGEEEGRSSSKVSDNKGELSRNTEW